MKLIAVLFCLFAFLATPLSAQTYVSVVEQDSTSRLLLAFALRRDFDYDVRNFRVVYNTTDVFGAPTVASGLLTLPSDPANAYPLMVYSHGTVSNVDLIPGNEAPGNLERVLIQGLGASGYITVAPDYLGLGENDAPVHPYVHAASQASAGRDLLLAARQYLDENDIAYNDQLFLTGYSQGGHATQALHRDIQTSPGDDNLAVTAATHLSGPYSISDVMRNTLFSDSLSTLPGYIVYTYISYDYVYDLFDDFTEIFTDEYVGIIDSFVAGRTSLDEFNTSLAVRLDRNDQILGDMLQPDIREQLRTKDTTSATVRALLDNDTYDWAPEAPTVIYYCTLDEQVPFRNAIIADSVMSANGSTSVSLETGGALTHGDCIVPAVTRTLEFFAPLAEVNPVSVSTIVSASEVSVGPNPLLRGDDLRVIGLPAGDHTYLLYDQAGRMIARGSVSASGSLQLPTDLPVGLQTLRLELGDGRVTVRRVLVR